MADEKQEAAQAASQARGEAKAAVRDGGRAVKTVAEPVLDAVVEEVQDAAQKAEGTVQDAANAVKRTNVDEIVNRVVDVGWGCFALSVSIYTGQVAFQKFRSAFTR